MGCSVAACTKHAATDTLAIWHEAWHSLCRRNTP